MREDDFTTTVEGAAAHARMMDGVPLPQPKRWQPEHDELMRIGQSEPCKTCGVEAGEPCMDTVLRLRQGEVDTEPQPYVYADGRVATHSLRFPADTQERLMQWRREMREAWEAERAARETS